MPQRPKPTALQLIQGQRGRKKERPALAPPPEHRNQKVPRAPANFNDAEKRAWRDICKPLCDRGLWSDHLALWAESFAYLLAVSRSECRNDPDFKVNRAQLRLYARDQQTIVDFTTPPKGPNPFAEFD